MGCEKSFSSHSSTDIGAVDGYLKAFADQSGFSISYKDGSGVESDASHLYGSVLAGDSYSGNVGDFLVQVVNSTQLLFDVTACNRFGFGDGESCFDVVALDDTVASTIVATPVPASLPLLLGALLGGGALARRFKRG